MPNLPGKGAGPFAVMREPDAARLWFAGFSVSVMRWLEMLAYSLFALEVTGSPLMVALTVVCRMGPLLVTTPFLAALAEGTDRRRALALAFAAMTALFALLLAVDVAAGVGIGLVLLASLAAGAFWSLEFPLRRTMLAEVGGLHQVGASMGLEITSNQATRVLGALLGGASVAWLGLAGVFAIGLLLYGAGTALVLTLRAKPGPRRPATRVGHLLAGVADGLRAVRGNGLLEATIAVSAAFNLFGFPYVALAPVVAERRYGLGPDGIGVLMACEPLAAVFGGLLFAALVPDRLFRAVYAAGPLLFVTGTGLFTFAASVAPAALALAVAGFGMAGFATGQMVLPMRAAPPGMRVRVVGLVATSIGVAPLGLLQAGLLAEWLGAIDAQRVLGLEGLLAMGLILRRWPELLALRPPEETAVREVG